MCHFLSFCVNTSVLEGEPLKVFIGDGTSHDGIERGWELKPGECCECEWTDDGEWSLKVRVGGDDSAVRAAILAVYPTRDALFASLKEGRAVSGNCRERTRFRFTGGNLFAIHYRHRRHNHVILHRRNGRLRSEEWYDPDRRAWYDMRSRRIPAGNLLARIKRHCAPLMEL